MSQLRDRVADAVRDTPYVVEDTDAGFDLRLDVTDSRWWGLLKRSRLRIRFTWRVAEHPDHITITDIEDRISWSAGVPSVRGGVRRRVGRVLSRAAQTTWALSDDGRIERVVDYRFDSAEGRDVIRLAATQLGIPEKQPLSVKVGIAAAAFAVGGLLVGGLVLLVLWLVGVYP